MKVEIYSDVACPWCYVGKHRFESALGEFAGRGDVEVVMRPFQLDPTLPGDPQQAIPAATHYARKFGPQFKQMEARLIDVARQDGIDYQADKILVANTLNAHRLMWLAEQEGGSDLQGRVAEALFKAYFTEGRVVSSPETLVEVAAQAGMAPERVRTFLASDEGAQEVGHQLQGARERGITSVPTFVFEDRWAVSGAQEVATFLEVLGAVAQNLEAEIHAGHAEGCDDGACSI